MDHNTPKSEEENIYIYIYIYIYKKRENLENSIIKKKNKHTNTEGGRFGSKLDLEVKIY